MSDDFIVLIPANPRARLDAGTAASLEATHAEIVGSSETRLKDFGERLQFIDCGGNFKAMLCPACSKAARTDWWGRRMDHAWDADHGFHLCDFAMPCCGAPARLDTLVYRPQQGFSTWFLSARNESRGPLNAGELARLEHVAGIPLKVIYQHY